MINNLRGILGREDFQKGFFGYARVLGLRKLIKGNLKSKSTILEVFWAVGTSQRGFFSMHVSKASEGLL